MFGNSRWPFWGKCRASLHKDLAVRSEHLGFGEETSPFQVNGPPVLHRFHLCVDADKSLLGKAKTYAHIEANLLRCSGNFPKPRILQPTKDFQRLSESRLGFPQLSLDLCRGQMVTLATGDNKDPGETVLQCAITREINQTLNNARHSLIPGFPIRSKMHFLTN